MTPSFGLIRLILKSARRIKRIEQALDITYARIIDIMATLDDVKAAEQAEGESIAALVALTDKIFAMLSAAPSDDPRVQEVLDLIAANKQQADDATARDTPPVA